MLTSLSLRQFKSFRDLATVPLAPLTLIYGANSGGKSTIVQALMLLKQSLDSAAAPGSPLIFGSDTYLDLGNFQNIVSDHDVARAITLSLSVDNLKNVYLRSLSQPLRDLFESASISFNFATNDTGAPILTEIELHVEEGAPAVAVYTVSKHKPSREQLLNILGPRTRRLRNNSRSAETTFLELATMDMSSSLIDLCYAHFMESLPDTRKALAAPSRFDFSGLDEAGMDEVEVSTIRTRIIERDDRCKWWLDRLENYGIAEYRNDFLDFSKSSLLAIDRFLPVVRMQKNLRTNGLTLNHLANSDRAQVKRPMIDIAQLLTVIGFGIEDELERLTYVGPLREFPERNYIFSAGGEKTVGLRGENLPAILFSSPTHVQELNRLAHLMELGYEISVHRSSDSELDNVFAVRLTDQITKARVGISDVGFGVSQILPILLQCALRPHGCIVMEQPEIHLNPRLQASLGEVFASAVTRGRQQLIIETHSEHLLLRLQRLIKDGRLESNKLSVIYVSKSERGSTIMPILIGSDGDRLTAWPDGFFDDTYRELFDVSR